MAINHMKLKAAIKAYSEAEGDHAAKMEAVAAKGYTEAELAEITEAISQLSPNPPIEEPTKTPPAKAETEIIPDGKPTPSKSTRKGVPSAAAGENVYLYNKQTGRKNLLPLKGALRMVNQNPEQFSIVD